MGFRTCLATSKIYRSNDGDPTLPRWAGAWAP